MSPRRALALLALAAAAPLLAGCITGDGALEGKPAPDFDLTTLDGRPVNLSTYAGKWLVLDLMATWCGPCKAETAHLKEVQRTFGDRVAILSVDADASETAEDLGEFRDKYATPWDYAADPTGRVADAYNLRIIPKMVLIDPHGIVRFEGSGEVYPQTLARVIEPTATATSPVLAPALLALAAGFLVALNPYHARRRAALRAAPTTARAAYALAAALAVALAVAAYAASGFLSGRATYTTLGVGGISLAAALWYPMWVKRGKDQEPDGPARPLQSALDLLYYGAPALVAAAALGLRGTGWLPFAAPFAAALAGAAGALALEGRHAVDPRVASLALAAVGVGLVVLALAGGASV